MLAVTPRDARCDCDESELVGDDASGPLIQRVEVVLCESIELAGTPGVEVETSLP